MSPQHTNNQMPWTSTAPALGPRRVEREVVVGTIV